MKMADAMAQIQADRNLLFGILALQMDFITKDGLVAAMNAWVLNKQAQLGELLVERKLMDSDRRSLLNALMEEHVKLHGGIEQSLAALSAVDTVVEELRSIADGDLQASLVGIAHQVTAMGRSTLPLTGMRTNGKSNGSVASVAIAAPPEKKISRFEVLRPHAGGGLGEVFVARDTELNREVALKQIRPRHADNLESRARFLLEAEVTGGLEHPGIVPVYGLGAYDDGRPYYAMRFIRGDSLQDCIRKFFAADGNLKRDPCERALALRELLRRFVDVCNAMEYAHSRGVLHRDLKPGNIMVGKYGETLVVDWGLAKPLDQIEETDLTAEGALRPMSATGTVETQVGRAVGTPAYMSPEQAAGRIDQLGPASDVYSLGATLFALLTGRAPFEGGDVGSTLQRVQRGDFPKPRIVNNRVPKPLEAICVRAMALQPADRYASPQALAHDLEHWLADEPVAAYKETASEKIGRWTRRHRAIAQSSVVALLAIAVISMIACALIERARDAEAEARKNESIARAEAEASFQDAKNAVNEFFTKVSEEKLLEVPGLQPLRRELLESAERYYTGFIQDRGDDPDLKLDLAAAHYRVGRIADEIGTNQAALESFNRAMQVQAAAAQAPDAPMSVMEDLANTHNAMGEVLMESGMLPDAQDSFAKAHKLRDDLVRRVDRDGKLRRKLANSINNMAAVQAMMGKPQSAITEFERALDEREKLVLDFPKESLYLSDLAEGYYNLAAFHLQHENPVAARESLEKALAAYRDVLNLEPGNPDFERGMALSWRELGRAEQSTGNREAASKAYEESRDLLDRLSAKNPFVVEYQADNAAVYIDLANLSEEAPQLAIEWLTRARTILERLVKLDPGDARYASDLLVCLTNLGLNQLHAGQAIASRDTLEQALAKYQAQVDEHPTLQQDEKLLTHEADLRYAVALARAQSNNLSEALPVYQQAEKLREKLLQAAPRDAGRLMALARLQDELAVVHSRLGNPDQAIAACREATPHFRAAREMKLDEPSRQELRQHLRQLAVFEREFGGMDESLAALSEQRALSGDNAEELYATTLEYCANADWVGGDEEDALTVEELAQRNRCLDEALTTLQAAVAAGYDRAKLNDDQELGLLRDDPDFQHWLGKP
jgi:serine/threonine protein kinase/tetratricopeptide (TPR) repeat protein